MRTTNVAASTAVENTAQGLGALVWWSLTDTAITPARMRSILAAEGADPSIVPDIEQLSAMKRAVREWSSGRGHSDRYRAEVAAISQASVLTIGILRREQVTAGEVRWVQIDTCEFDAINAAWTTPGATEQARSFQAAADEIRTHLDHQWIRPSILVRGLQAAQATSLRDRGGVYYVPRQNEAALDQLARIVAAIGRCKLDVIHAQATPASVATIGEGARGTMKEELDGLLGRLAGWSESARKVSDTNGANLLAELADLRSRAELYADALSISMSDLEEAVDAAKAEALRIIEGSAGGEKVSRAPSERGEPQGTASQRWIDILRIAMQGIEPDAEGTILIPAARAAEKGLRPHRYDLWSSGAGALAARAIGYVSRARGSGDAPGIILRPLGAPEPLPPQGEQNNEAGAASSELPGSPEAPLDAFVDETPTPETRVEPIEDAEEQIANAREALAGKTKAELAESYKTAKGEAPPASWPKAKLIEEILSLIS